MAIFKQKLKKAPVEPSVQVQTRPKEDQAFLPLDQYIPLVTPEVRLYQAMREAIPVIDTALFKIERLIGGFRITCDNSEAQELLDDFVVNIPVGASSKGLEYFICSYLDSLLFYGNAVAEIVLDKEQRRVVGLYNAAPEEVVIEKGDTPFSSKICCVPEIGDPVPVPYPQLICFSAFNPQPGNVCGDSILKSLPFVSSILIKIYQAIGKNFDRIGNIRFAVNYKPSNDSVDKAYAKERAEQIAREWSEGMAASRRGDVRDFIAVGDIDIKVIGAENQLIDCEVPARQMLEQIVAKLSLPPFMLGLSWSTTERMSQQQADMLYNEITYYRRLLFPTIKRITETFLQINGYCEEVSIAWDALDFGDEIDAAKSRLYNAQAEKIELENGTNPMRIPVDVSTENAK